jgi:hypothetical protein
MPKRIKAKTNAHAFANDEGRPRTQTSVVAYFDVLRFTDEMRAAHRRRGDDEFLNRVASTVKDWYEAMRDTFSEEWGHRRGWELKAFSDNVVVGHPIHHGGESELGQVMSNLATLQLAFALEGRLFLRGAIAVGDLYMDEDIIYGVGLLDAVEAERAADVPRVVLHESAAKYVREQIRRYASIRLAPHTRVLLRDEDGRIFINYLSGIWQDPSEPPFYPALENHRDIVADRLRTFRRFPKVWAKYAWVARYHNYFCNSLPGGAEYALDVTLLSLDAARLDEIFKNRRIGQKRHRRR